MAITKEQRSLAKYVNDMLVLAKGDADTTAFARCIAHNELRDTSHAAARKAAPWPLIEHGRVHEDSWDSWYEYGFMPPWVETDADADEWCEDNTYRIYSPYDCTGKPHTKWIDWHRNPCGRYSYVHRVALDV